MTRTEKLREFLSSFGPAVRGPRKELEVSHNAERLEAQLRAAIAEEQYTRATVRPLGNSLAREHREQIERHVVRSTAQETTGPLDMLTYF